MHFVGIATDGATFIPYELRSGTLIQFEPFVIPVEKPRELLAWLSSVVAVNADLEPNAEIIQRELGRASLAWNVALHDLSAVWSEVSQHPDVALKRSSGHN